jgi:hypothetical protein
MAGKLNRAQRLADGVDVDLGRGVLGESALQQMRYPAGEFDHFLATADLTERVGDDLAVLAGDDFGQFTLTLVEQLPELEQNRAAPGQRSVPPFRECRNRGVDDRAGVLHAGQRDVTGHLTRRGVGHRRRRAAVAGECLVVEPMRNGLAHDHFPYFEMYSVMVFSW